MNNVTTDSDYVEFHKMTVSEIVVPLITEGKVTGVLNLESDRAEAFNQDDVSTLEVIARVGVLALERLASRREASRVKEELQRFREDFTNSLLAAGHDLKTPLTTIKGLTQVLLANELGHLSEEMLDRLRIILDETNAELRTATNLCDTVAIHESKPEMERQNRDLSALANAVVERFSSTAARRNISLKSLIEPDIFLPINEKIELVFTNLIDNALKVTSGMGGTVTVIVRATAEGALCSVEDTGPGIAFNELDHVFDRFYKGSGSKRNGEAGMGIGLSVSKYFIEQHNGRIWIDQAANPTRISFELRR